MFHTTRQEPHLLRDVLHTAVSAQYSHVLSVVKPAGGRILLGTQLRRGAYKDHIAGWVSCEADSGAEISMWMLIREHSWEGSRNGQREKLSCIAVPTTAIAKIMSTLAPSWPFRVALS